MTESERLINNEKIISEKMSVQSPVTPKEMRLCKELVTNLVEPHLQDLVNKINEALFEKYSVTAEAELNWIFTKHQ